jgi:hypothetical protein
MTAPDRRWIVSEGEKKKKECDEVLWLWVIRRPFSLHLTFISIQIYCELSVSLLLVALLDDLSYSLTHTSKLLIFFSPDLYNLLCANAPAYASCDEFH